MHQPTDPGGTFNKISGGIVIGPAILGKQVSLTLPPQIPTALAGLPEVSPVFTGRVEPLKDLLDGLAPGHADGQQPVLVQSVAGLAGIGKTELVAQAAARALKQPDWFPGGMLFTNLSGYDPTRRVSPEIALDGWLRALGIPGEYIPEGLTNRQGLYRSVLAEFARQGQRILVIIDNASSSEQARPLLPTDGLNAALVTSRHTLDLGARLLDLGILDDEAAFALLAQVLHRAHGDRDTRVADDPQAAKDIATRLCAGLPLALRIVAALLADAPTRPLADIAEDLEAEHARLDELKREERAVRAAFDLSYQFLDHDHARLFRLLPLNPGPDISTEATAHLADTDPRDVKKLLQDLARAHLVEQGKSWGRWGLHDLVRLYADEQGRTHDTPDQRHTAQARLFTHYRTSTAAANTHLNTLPGTRSPRFQDRDEALQWLDAERTSLIATATAAPAIGHPDTTAHLAFALARYLDYRRRFDDWITITTTALTLFRSLGDRHGEGNALGNLGIALTEVRRFEEAVTTHTQAAAVFRELGDRHGEGRALGNLGSVLTEVRRFEEAITAHTQAAAVFRELDDRHSEGKALNNLGSALTEVRRYEEAITAHTQAAAVFRELDDRHSEATALNNLGSALTEVRRYEEAITAHTQAAAVFRELGDRHSEATALNNLGSALREVRRFEEAVTAVSQAVDIYRQLTADSCSGHDAELACSLLLLACAGVDEDEGRVLPGTLPAAQEAVELFDRLATEHPAEFTDLLRAALKLLANILELLGRIEEAEQVHRRLADMDPPEE